jgi:hypothetical protein
MMSTVQSDIDDADEILTQITRFLVPMEQLMPLLRQNGKEALYTMPHPRGFHPLICGSEAYRRFGALARRYLSNNPEKAARVSVDAYAEALRGEFSTRYLGDFETIDQLSVSKMLESAYQRTESKFEDAIYYMPCSIVAQADPSEFQLGPIRFLHKSRFMELYGQEIELTRENISQAHQKRVQEAVEKGHDPARVATPLQSRDHADFLVNGLLEFLDLHHWIAAVPVKNRESLKSKSIANLVLEEGLNILKLLVGADSGSEIRSPYQAGRPFNTAELARKSDGNLHVSMTHNYEGSLLGPKWFSRLARPDDYFLRTTGRTLVALTDSGIRRPLCERFLDAVTWYGEAVSESSPASRIVRFVSALERLTMTKKTDRITGIVTTRSAIFCEGFQGQGRDHWLSELKKLYNCRSGLVHGSISPYDESLTAVSSLAGGLVRWVILSMLRFFDKLGLENPTSSPAELEAEYLKLETLYPMRRNS